LEISATGQSPEATRFFVDALIDILDFKNEARKRPRQNALSAITGEITGVEKQIQEKQKEITVFGDFQQYFVSDGERAQRREPAKLRFCPICGRNTVAGIDAGTVGEHAMPAGASTGVVLPGQKTG
jgi:hypothetical protein